MGSVLVRPHFRPVMPALHPRGLRPRIPECGVHVPRNQVDLLSIVVGPIFGPIIPNMGPQVRMADALFSGVQQRVLAVLFGAPERSFYRNELLKLTASGKG